MRKKKILLPKHRRMLESVGENLRLARLRRRLSAAQVAERAGISRNTLYLLEKGGSGSSIATLFNVLMVLGLEGDFSNLAFDDELGRRLEDARLKSPKKRAPKKPTSLLEK
jgi:transcriptional regulator with XRE-family HTH domain